MAKRGAPCRLRDPNAGTIDNILRRCNDSPLLCAADEVRCTDPKPGFQVEQRLKGKIVAQKFQPLNIGDNFIWDEFTIDKPMTIKDSGKYAMAFGTHNATSTPVTLKMYATWKGGMRYTNLEYETCVYNVLEKLDVPHTLKNIKLYELPANIDELDLYLTGHSRTIATNKSLGNFQAMLSSLKQVLLKTYNIAYGESSSSKNVTQSAYLPEEARRRKAVTSRSASYPEPARATGYTKGNLNMFFQNMEIRVVVTHRVVGDSLEDFFRKLRNKPIIDSVLFQLLFTIHTLNQLGIQHNDLHAGNILVDLYPEADTGQYFIDGNVYEVPLPVKIYLFDFDQSSTAYCGPNKYLDEEYYSHFDKQRQEAMYETICTKNGICNERNLKFDMYTVIRNILGLTAIKWDDVADSLRVLIPEVYEEYPNRFYSPKYKSPGEPTEVASIEKVIEQLFSKWKY